MLYRTDKTTVRNPKNVDVVQHDNAYIDSDGDLHIHTAITGIMVTSADDLEELTDFNPASIAYTAGFTNVWQLGADGEWVAIIEEESSQDDSQEET